MKKLLLTTFLFLAFFESTSCLGNTINHPLGVSYTKIPEEMGDVRYIRIISLTKMLTVTGLTINDGNCAYQNTYFGPLTGKSRNIFPLRMVYGLKSRKISVYCTPYKVVVHSSIGDVIVHLNQ